MSTPSWLPDTIEMSDYGGNWDDYLEAIYTLFLDNYTKNDLNYNGTRIASKKHPEIAGKSATFWHIISSGRVEAEKIPDLDRCKRILWARSIIENSADSEILVWVEEGYSGGSRTLLWLKNHDYLVVLANRDGYTLLWTAYNVYGSHNRRKLQQAYEGSIAN